MCETSGWFSKNYLFCEKYTNPEKNISFFARCCDKRKSRTLSVSVKHHKFVEKSCRDTLQALKNRV